MKFFFPDSQDQIDPSFDFESETRSSNRVRQRDELYVHEALSKPPIDGLLVSKAVVDGIGGANGKYTISQRQRLYRVGVRDFFRLNHKEGKIIESMGDCGAFSYVKESVPPYTVDEVINFYHECGFDIGASIDHVILGFNEKFDSSFPQWSSVPEDWIARQRITLSLSQKFIERHRARDCKFIPMGVAQGWSPVSYARAVVELQIQGYKKIALGGMVPLKSEQILKCLQKVNEILSKDTELHLFGVTRLDQIIEFSKYGVTSFDSTSPFRQAFKDENNNYFTANRAYKAIRVPQVDGNLHLKRLILNGTIDQARAQDLESRCLRLLFDYEHGRSSIDETLSTVCEYEKLQGIKKSSINDYRELLSDKPWQQCNCDICAKIGINVIILRGSERNRRRGFHNLHVFYLNLNNIFEKSSDYLSNGVTPCQTSKC